MTPDRPEAPPAPERPRAEPDLRGERFWTLGFPLLTVVLALSVPALLVTGRNVVLHSTDGALERLVTDPSAPGWAAFAEPTPVALVVHRGDAGALAGITLVSLTGADNGAVVFIPVDTLVAGDAGGRTLAEVDAGGEDALRQAVEGLIGFSPSDVVNLDAGGWREAVAAVAPLTVENPDPLFVNGPDGRPSLRFAPGPLVLSAADVADYLVLRNFGERDLNRLVRHEALWRAWLQSLGRATPAAGSAGAPAPPGALARYVDALAGDQVDMITLPVQVVPGDGSPVEHYTPVADQAGALIARVVPFPVGGPESRLRIRLLDGVGTLQHGLVAAPVLVGRGGQIDQLGNAAAFGVATTKLELADEAHRREVEELAAGLGVGEIVKSASIPGGTDVVVTLGQDYIDARAAGRGGTGG